MVATAESGGNGLAVCFAFSFEKGETCIRRVADDLRQRWMLEEVFPKVGKRIRHGQSVTIDNSVSSATSVKLLSLR